ncbi:MAG TPA: fumarylacetoacetate hydrolase family protein [Xanthobacteraceae bacterium]|jgi:2-keto-4-pentenoate hydratase/2-oxohepta-3-ene-1,7-dioic acid hydratase in catechol pathway
MPSYKLVSYRSKSGPRAGVVIDHNMFDAAELTGRPNYATVLGILEDWATAHGTLQNIKPGSGAQSTPLSRAELLAPVLWPSSIYCAGANYSDHVQEMAHARGATPEPDPHTVGLKPWHFLKSPRSVVGPGAAVPLPPASKMVDWEAELVAVVGKTAKDVPLEKALDYVAGYTIANDLSARDLMRRTPVSEGSPFRHDWIGQKCFDGACPLGPYIVPAAEIADPQNLSMKLSVNGDVKQDSSTSYMIFTLAEQLSHLSSRITLHPGDLILTGTPAGVGMGRKEFLKPGDVVTIEIENLGTLSNPMV